MTETALSEIRLRVHKSEIIELLRMLIVDANGSFNANEWSSRDADILEQAAKKVKKEIAIREDENILKIKIHPRGNNKIVKDRLVGIVTSQLINLRDGLNQLSILELKILRDEIENILTRDSNEN